MQKVKHREDFLAAFFCLIALFSFFIVNTTILRTHTFTLQMIMQVGVLATVGIAFWIMTAYPECDRTKVIVGMVLTLGAIMRIGYMLYTPATVRQHDIGDISPEGIGHAGYVYWLLEGSLPDSNACQFYHPPLYHLMAAVAVRCYQAISGLEDFTITVEAAKTVSCCASILTLLYADKICRYLKLSDGGRLLAISLAAFLPNHYLLAGRINNDALAVLFMTAILYYTLRWYHEQSWPTTIKLALCFGLGMMSKISVGVYALITGSMMLIVLARRIRNQTVQPLLYQYGVFAAIAFPLGLWYPIRNYLRFGQPFSYVLRISEDSDIFCGNFSLWQRFGLASDFSRLYDRPYDDYNVWGYLWRGSLFGEFSFKVGTVLPLLLLITNFLLIAASLAAMIAVLRQKQADWIILGLFWAVQLGSYLSFNLQYPFGCTMDFRYIVPTALIGALFWAKGWETMSKLGIRGICRKTAPLAVAMFSTLSIVMYCNVR